MSLYFYSLSDDTWPGEAGEWLPDDEAAIKYAETIAIELGHNGYCPELFIFRATGERITSVRMMCGCLSSIRNDSAGFCPL